jgi:diadenosine tetraphosphate (Ap4A) HIT family hydrolase
MEKDISCSYCMEGELVSKFGIKICELETSKLYLFKEQGHEGRVIVAHKSHIGDMTELSVSERNDFFSDIAKVSKALQKAFNPDKINYGAYGDTGHHLHFHLVPKYKDGFEWGGIFAMNPDQTYLSEDKYQEIIAKIIKYL